MTVDCVYIAASTHDARFTRICVASVRAWHPDVPIRLLAGGRLQPGLADELAHYWNVGRAAVPADDYGWGFVKLEPLFGAGGERFLMLDSDTVMTGPLLHAWSDNDAPFLVDDEVQSPEKERRLYYDWEAVKKIDPAAQRPAFVFNSGQWFGTAGVLGREDFSPWVRWTMPRRLVHPDAFMPGDQGVLNYVLNQKAALQGLGVERRVIMRWPGHSMEGLSPSSVAGGAAPTLIVHWAGMKRARLRDMKGAELLNHFERRYYDRMPLGSARRLIRGSTHALQVIADGLRTRARLAHRRWR